MLFSSLTWPTASQCIDTRNECGTHVIRHLLTSLCRLDAHLVKMSSLGLWAHSSGHHLCFDPLRHVNVMGGGNSAEARFNFPLHTQGVGLDRRRFGRQSNKTSRP